MTGQIVVAAMVPGMPHLLAQEPAKGWAVLADAVRELGDELRKAQVDSLLLVSTQWMSVLGLQIQMRARLEGVRVDENWYRYDFGTVPYSIRTDLGLSQFWLDELRARQFQARAIDHQHFPVDTGLVTAIRLLDPQGQFAVSQVSLNLYGTPELSEQVGQAGAKAVARSGHRVAAVAIGGLSSHPLRTWIAPDQDAIATPADEALNSRVIELLAEGNIEAFYAARADIVSRAAMDGQLRGVSFLHGAVGLARPARVHAYAPVWGMGAAVLSWPVSH